MGLRRQQKRTDVKFGADPHDFKDDTARETYVGRLEGIIKIQAGLNHPYSHAKIQATLQEISYIESGHKTANELIRKYDLTKKYKIREETKTLSRESFAGKSLRRM